MLVLQFMFMLFFVVLNVLGKSIGDNSSVGNGLFSLSFIEIFEENLHIEDYDSNIDCYKQMKKILNNARNSTLWATWVIDSMQFPTGVLYGSQYQLGNFDECMTRPWTDNMELSTKYCLADVKFSKAKHSRIGQADPYEKTQVYVNSMTKYGRYLNTITWGLCVPSSCSQQSVSKILEALFRISHLGKTSIPQITVDECQTPQSSENNTGIRMFIYSLLILFTTALLSTSYLAFDNGTSNSVIKTIARCFCMKNNVYDLVKKSNQDISCMNGMRAMTAILILLGHQVLIVTMAAVGNTLHFDKIMEKLFFLIHIDIFTDTFFFFSGVLLAKGLLSKTEMKNPFIILWKRYIRLMVPVACVMFFYTVVFTHTGDGPIWARLVSLEQSMCEKTWWLSILMLSNYVKNDEMCMLNTWSIPVTFHLTALGVFLIYLCRRHRNIGLASVAITTLLAVLLPPFATYKYQLPATLFFDIKYLFDLRHNVYFVNMYVLTHYKISSYLIGLAFGYFMTIYKTNQYRGSISRNQSILMFGLSFVVACAMLAAGGFFLSRPYDVTEAVIQAATNRIMWVVAIACMVITCEYGKLPIISRFLDWSVWVPLGRLSYGVSLTHPIIIIYDAFSARSPSTFNIFTVVSHACGTLVISYITSLLIWILVQAPTENLINIKFDRRKEPNRVGNGANINGINDLLDHDNKVKKCL